MKASEDASNVVTSVELPASSEETVKQATSAVNAAIADGQILVDVEFVLPLIGATDLDDWPGGVRQMFKAAAPMVEEMLRNIPGVMEKGGCRTEILDQADAIGLWDGKGIAAVLFPTADTVDEIMDLAKKDRSRPILTVNTQWTYGQVISDFGFGPWKERRETFINSFEPAYCLRSFRVLGENVRILRAYPGTWKVYAIAEGAEPELVGETESKPAYKDLEKMLRAREGSISNKSIFERLSSEFKFNADSMREQKMK